MITYWVSFAGKDRFFGVVIVDGDDAWNDKTVVRKIIKLGCVPGPSDVSPRHRIKSVSSVKIQRLHPGKFDPIPERYKNRLLTKDEIDQWNACGNQSVENPIELFDLVIGLIPDTGMVGVSVKLNIGLDDLTLDLKDDGKGRAIGQLCGGCAKKALASIVNRKDLSVAQAFKGGRTLRSLYVGEDRKLLLASIGQHVH
jgi:hypothetical protein